MGVREEEEEDLDVDDMVGEVVCRSVGGSRSWRACVRALWRVTESDGCGVVDGRVGELELELWDVARPRLDMLLGVCRGNDSPAHILFMVRIASTVRGKV